MTKSSEILSNNNVHKVTDLIDPAYMYMWYTKKETVSIKGSKGSGKSYTTAMWHIWFMMKFEGANVLTIRQTANTLKDSCYADYLKAINRLGVAEYWDHTVHPLELTYYPDKDRSHKYYKILFRGLDDAEKVASITVTHGYLCWVWFEEASKIMNYEEVQKIIFSIRAVPPESGLWKRFTFTFNPWSPMHWLKEKHFDVQDPNILAMTTTYLNNPALTAEDRRAYRELDITSPKAARVIVHGDWGVSEGLIYDNFIEEDFDVDEIRSRKNIISTFGLDFGYKTSYNAFVAVLVDPYRHELWVYDEMYSKGMENLDIAKMINQMGYGKESIIADSAELKSVSELKTGMIEETVSSDGTPIFTRWALPNIKPAQKGPDSVRNGIDRLQRYFMHIHTKCRNLLTELSVYSWKVDSKTGKPVDPPEPEKDLDHACDALRYSMEKLFAHGHARLAIAKGMTNIKETEFVKAKQMTIDGEEVQSVNKDRPRRVVTTRTRRT